MKTTLTTLLLSALLLIGCADDSSYLTSTDDQINNNSNSPNYIQLPETEGMSIENQFSVTKHVSKKHGGELIIDETYNGGPHGQVKVIAKFKLKKNTLKKSTTITMTIDNETGAIIFSPPTAFKKAAELYVKFEGLDLYNVDPNSVEFIDQTPDNNIYPVEYESLDIDVSSGTIELKAKPFIVDDSRISYKVMEIGGSRYAWMR
jgi:hypothetical protein